MVEKPLTFSHVSRILELKTQFDENIGSIGVPAARASLTTENAMWFVNNARRPATKRGNNFDFVHKICLQYLEMAKLKYVI